MGGFTVDCGFSGVGLSLVRVARKGSPSVPGSFMVDLICGSVELRYS